jgi:hypothetical protein
MTAGSRASSAPARSRRRCGNARDAQDADGDHAAIEQARREIADCDAKLRAHRAALEAGADPAIVAGWMAEVQAQRVVAEARLRQGSGRQRMTAEEITRVVSSLRDLMSVLAAADPVDKAQIYSQLGLALTYHPGSQTVRTEARPLAMYVRIVSEGGLHPKPNVCSRVNSQLGLVMTPAADPAGCCHGRCLWWAVPGSHRSLRQS